VRLTNKAFEALIIGVVWFLLIIINLQKDNSKNLRKAGN